jgi:hypothetical protein
MSSRGPLTQRTGLPPIQAQLLVDPSPEPAVVLHLIGQPDPDIGPQLPVGHDVAEPSGRGGDQAGGPSGVLVGGEAHQEPAAAADPFASQTLIFQGPRADATARERLAAFSI